MMAPTSAGARRLYVYLFATAAVVLGLIVLIAGPSDEVDLLAGAVLALGLAGVLAVLP